MFPFKLLLAVSSLMIAQWSHADVYRWTDEEGNVHYGDSKPEDRKSTEMAVEVESPAGQEVAPIAKPRGNSVRKVFIEYPSMPWSENPEQIYSLGNYYFGDSCSALPTAMNWPDLNAKHSSFLVKDSEIASIVHGVLSHWSYPVRVIHDHRGVDRLADEKGYLLRAQFKSVQLDVCSRDGYKKVLNGHFSDLNASKFPTKRAEVRVVWQLLDSGRTSVLYEVETVSSEDNWNQSWVKPGIMRRVIKTAAEKLLSDADFASLVGEAVEPQPVQSDPRPHISSPKELSLWDKVSPWKAYERYLLKARLSEVLVEMTGIKTYVAQHYVEYGEWPNSLAELGIQSAEIIDGNRSVADISLYGGAIYARLDESFGNDMEIALIPKVYSPGHSIRWMCESNLPVTVIPAGLDCVSGY